MHPQVKVRRITRLLFSASLGFGQGLLCWVYFGGKLCQIVFGTEDSARLHVRAMALLWNFHPYGSRTTASDLHWCSPFKDLNGFEYHENWLRNLLIAGSMNGYR